MTTTASGQVAALLAQAAQALRGGRPGEAIPLLAQVAQLRPGEAAILHDWGAACLDAGRPGEAVGVLAAAIAANPRFTRAHLWLGMAHEALGRAAEAIDAYRAAATLQPSLTEALFRAGNLLELMGHRGEAKAAFRRAGAASAKTPLSRLAAARALLLEGRHGEAETALRRAVALDPNAVMALDLLGTVLADAGRFDEARDCFTRAIARAPLLAGSFYDLVRCRTLAEGDRPLLAQMRAALDLPGLAAEQRARVHLALGKAADDLGDPAEAMRQFDAADAIRARLVDADIASFAAQVDRLIARVTPDVVAQAATWGGADERAVLILGMPRSGTTLVEQIVSSHPAVAAGEELPFWTECGARWDAAGAAGMTAAFLQQAAGEYGRVLDGIAPKASRVTDKMPLNFIWAGLIHLALPRATIIHCRRDPLDTALSIHQTFFNPRLRMPTGGAALVAYWRLYRRLTEHWRAVLPADRFVEIEYEALTASPAVEIPRLIAATGLPWDAACLAPERNTRLVRTPSKWQARQPINRGSVGRARRYLPFLGALGALADSTG